MQKEIDSLVGGRVRGLRLARGWTLEALASRCELSPSTLSRIETGHQRITLEHLVALSHALDTSLDRHGMFIAKMRITQDRENEDLQVHPGNEWFTVLSGVVRLQLGAREILVYPGQAVEFSTMTPHLIQAHEEPAELLIMLDRDGEQAHLPTRGQQ